MDLLVWYEELRVTGDEARRRLDEAHWRESEFPPHPNVRAFYDIVMEIAKESDHVPAGERQWWIIPQPSDRLVWLALGWSTPDAVLVRIQEAAAALGLALFDPQSDEIYLPPRLNRQLRISVGDRTVTNPDPDVAAHLVRRALASRSEVRLTDDALGMAHVVATSSAADNERTSYAVDYQVDPSGPTRRLHTIDIQDVIVVFDAFLRDDPSILTASPGQPRS
jgi:hypothetical protein